MPSWEFEDDWEEELVHISGSDSSSDSSIESENIATDVAIKLKKMMRDKYCKVCKKFTGKYNKHYDTETHRLEVLKWIGDKLNTDDSGRKRRIYCEACNLALTSIHDVHYRTDRHDLVAQYYCFFCKIIFSERCYDDHRITEKHREKKLFVASEVPTTKYESEIEYLSRKFATYIEISKKLQNKLQASKCSICETAGTLQHYRGRKHGVKVRNWIQYQAKVLNYDLISIQHIYCHPCHKILPDPKLAWDHYHYPEHCDLVIKYCNKCTKFVPDMEAHLKSSKHTKKRKSRSRKRFNYFRLE